MRLLTDVAAGRESWRRVREYAGSWEKPVRLIAALEGRREARFDALDLVNDGQIPNLPMGVFVETPCRVSEAGIAAECVSLPEPVLPYAEQTARVTDLVVKAATDKRLGSLRQAVDADPTILDKNAGLEAVLACLEAEGVRPAWGG